MGRGIGMVQATAMNMSNMVGIGPFITIPILMTALGGWIFLLMTTDQKMLACGALVLVLGVVAYSMLAGLARRWPFVSDQSKLKP